MASSKLQQLKTTLSMGARGNKYKVMIAAPHGPKDDIIIDTLAKGGAIPAKSMGIVEVWTQGRKLLVAGDATWENSWALTFWNTQDMELRSQFDDWLTFIDDQEGHGRGAMTHIDYMSESAKIEQLNTSTNCVTATYEFRNLWPTEISSIEMADDQQDTITEFTCTFAYSHWIRTDTYNSYAGSCQ